MRFVVDFQPTPGPEPIVVLVGDGWNDWFTWYTLFSATILMPDGSRIDLGGVKIGQKGMLEGNPRTQLPTAFETLDETYFSIGQTENYYETLNALPPGVRTSYLTALRDAAYSLQILDDNESEPVLHRSLLRDIETSRVRDRFHRLAHGRAALTGYRFEYQFPHDPIAHTPPPKLSFEVKTNVLPATNIHVLIGRNGVGKTRCFDFLARSFLGLQADDPEQPIGSLIPSAPSPFATFGIAPGSDFAGLVTVSFSAFDTKGPLQKPGEGQKRYAYVGLVTTTEPAPPSSSAYANLPLASGFPSLPAPRSPLPIPMPPTPFPGSAYSGPPRTGPALRVKSSSELGAEFARSVLVCREGVRRDRWKRALALLEADPLFAEQAIADIADDTAPNLEERAARFFERLSSGHAAVLLSVTRLVELVEEKSLVLIDEPEGHLHPPLLSAFVRALSDLLIDRNGVAIIATHSPVVLQEVPRSCVWKLNRAGREVRADRPEMETFGENVGVLTREIFGLEVVQTGFHRLISDMAPTCTYDDIMLRFDGQLGAEGRALARSLSSVRVVPPEPGPSDL